MAKIGAVRVVIDEKAFEKAVREASGVKDILNSEVDRITKQANSLSSGMRSGIKHIDGERVGDTEPSFDGNVKKINGSYIGIVYTANYAAQKANTQSNILLKAKG